MPLSPPEHRDFVREAPLFDLVHIAHKTYFKLSNKEGLDCTILKPALKINDMFVTLLVETRIRLNEERGRFEVIASTLKIKSFKIVDGLKSDEKERYFPINNLEQIETILKRTFPRP